MHYTVCPYLEQGVAVEVVRGLLKGIRGQLVGSLRSRNTKKPPQVELVWMVYEHFHPIIPR